MKTRYRRDRTCHALDELVGEVRALRAEVAVMRANQVQIVPYPYPVYPLAPQPHPWYPWQNPPSILTAPTSIMYGDGHTLTNTASLAPVAAGGWDGGMNVTFGNAGD